MQKRIHKIISLSVGITVILYGIISAVICWRCCTLSASHSDLYLLISLLTMLFISGGALIVIACIVSIGISKRLVEPVEQFSEQLELIYKTDGEPVRLTSDCEELAPVAASVNNLYDRLILQMEDVQKTARIRREFSANVSHELKTPLTTIKGFGEMLENGIISNETEVRKYGGTIYRESERLLGLINDIIKLSEIEEGVHKDDMIAETDLHALASEAIKFLDSKACMHNVTVTLEGTECLWNVHDGYMLELFINLIDNAIKYNRRGGYVYVSISKTADGETCVISVKDTGIGIPAEHQQRIFERFYRVDKSRSKLTGGTGLGLSIVKYIAAFHHGSVNLYSHVNEGTEIIVRIPKPTQEM